MNTPLCRWLPALLLPAGLWAQEPCQVVRPIRTTLQQYAGLPGKVVAEQRLELRARITGYLAEIRVDHGSEVKRGELLARLDVPDLDARLAQAEAALVEAVAAVADAIAARDLARAKIDEARGGVAVCAADVALAEVQAARTRKLVEKQGATPQELDEAEGRLAMARARGQMAEAVLRTAEAGVRAAEAAVMSAGARQASRTAEVAETRAMLAFARLECPFAQGVVTRRLLDPGALVRKDETVILELQRTDRVRAEFHVPERDVARVRAGTPVDLRFDAISDAPVQGAVARISRAITSSKVMVVQVDLQNPEGRLLPGMFVHANLLLESADGALTLPARALRSGGDGKHHVLVAVEGVARQVPVTVGADNGIRVRVDAGLAGGEAVILAGDVKAGDPVRVTETGR